MNWLLRHTFARRCVSISLYAILGALVLVTMPVWVPIAWIAGLLFQQARSALRCLLFISAYLCCEFVGTVASFWIWLLHGLPSQNTEAAYVNANIRLQNWWADSLRRAAQRLFRLKFDIAGQEVLHGPGAIFLPRHTSIGDTVFPVSFYALPQGLSVRYVLKRELLLDPCLDIVGNRLPNYFIDRSADDKNVELAALEALAASASDKETLVIYIEGTRYTQAKRDRILQTLSQRDDAAAYDRAERWHHLLPPRAAGTLALMQGAPEKDLLFCAHTGFEGSASFATLFNGGWLDTTVRLRFWRVSAADIPPDEEGRRDLLIQQWDRMHDTVAELISLEG